ncbi:MAG: hypothetical protein LBJ67_13930 [Planctomycetaceae bacterium]|nr:hypothetical protein [Planctomycetaceae bacterium]
MMIYLWVVTDYVTFSRRLKILASRIFSFLHASGNNFRLRYNCQPFCSSCY